MHTAKS